MTKILAFDPGVTTGVTVWTENIMQSTQNKYTPGEMSLYLRTQQPTEIVYERFIYQRRSRVELFPVQIIGVIEAYAELAGVPVKVQTPSQAKNLWTDEKLKKLGLWEISKPHAMDALRHMMYYLVVTKGDRSWLNMLKPQ